MLGERIQVLPDSATEKFRLQCFVMRTGKENVGKVLTTCGMIVILDLSASKFKLEVGKPS